MKLLIKSVLLVALLATVFGCASSGDKFEARLAPPDEFNLQFQQYKQLPGEKAMVIAVDPGGRWAFGFDHSQNSLEEAAKNAAIKCDAAREKFKVFSKGKLFAMNDEVVYYDEYE